MIEIRIKHDENGDPYSDDPSCILKQGQEIKFTFPDGSSQYARMVSIDRAMEISGGHACGSCPFAMCLSCPSWDDQGRSPMCSTNLYMVKIGSGMEDL